MPDSGPFAATAFTAVGALLGSFLIVVIVAAGVAALCQKLTWAWLPIAIRIAGSWIAAIAMLLGALMLKAAA